MEEYTNYLAHHGVKGMRWGVRHDPKPTGRRSVRGNIHRGLAAVYRLNEKTYNKMGNKTMASMNASARKRQLDKANSIDKTKANKKASKASAKQELKNKLVSVDPSVAKNKQTKRVAMDYHNLQDSQFRRKYKTSKKTFAKRYEKSKGNTYKMGVRKAAVATFINAHAGNVTYYDLRTRRPKTIKNGKARAAKLLATDLAYSKVSTSIGYKKAEKKYNASK